MRDLINFGQQAALKPISFREEELLWSHHLGNTSSSLSKPLRICLLILSSIPALLVIVAYVYLILTTPDLILWFAISLAVLPAFFNVGRFAFFDILNVNLSYGVTRDRILFLEKPKQGLGHELFFKDITKIDLVNYKSKATSTIYFFTKHPVGFRGYDFEREESRKHPTLEEVPNGRQVYEILMEQWKLANFK